jgi:hypothetical protein
MKVARAIASCPSQRSPERPLLQSDCRLAMSIPEQDPPFKTAPTHAAPRPSASRARSAVAAHAGKKLRVKAVRCCR